MSSDLTFRPPRDPLVPPGGVDLQTRDMTATFSADLTLGEAQWRLGEVGQWLPIDGDPGASLGTLVETNSTGPLRLGFGAWRDLLLGVQFLNGRGELITAGGRTVKNVAGYDLTKFMVGQRGVFGRIVTLTTRAYRRPVGAVLARFKPDITTLPRLLPTDLRPQWAALTAQALFLGYVGDETTLDYYAKHLPATGPAETTRRLLVEDMNHRAELWVAPTAGANPFRASVPPSRLLDFVRGAKPAQWCADAAFGIVVGSAAPADGSTRLRNAAATVGGSIIFGGASEEPGEAAIIRRLKSAFDPEGTLPPLPWQTR
jgi:glycolate oxidase FAD binding subunit